MNDSLAVNNTYKLFVVLQFVIVISIFHLILMAAGKFQTAGNVILTLVFIISFIKYGRISFIRTSLIIMGIALFLYVLRLGNFTLGTPLLPFLGLFLVPQHYNVEDLRVKYQKRAKLLSLVNVFIIYIVGYVSTNYFDAHMVNNLSILFLQLILINIIFFREPFFFTVLLSVLLSTLLTPGVNSLGGILPFLDTHQGNRSAIFLILFLINKEYILRFFYFIKKKKYFIRTLLFIITFLIGAYVFLDYFLNREKNIDVTSDPRFLWFYSLIELLFTEGVVAFFNDGANLLYELGEGRTNPHNSFFYLLLAEFWVGLIKILVYILSIFIIPISAWSAIGARAFFDIFFLLGPMGMIFMVFVRVYYVETIFRWKKFYIRYIQQ
jgi:hypothetical protein